MHFLSLLRRLPRPALAAAIVAAVAAVLLSGCETTFNMGKKIDYKSAGSAPALEVPPDLTTPTYDDRYQSTTASGAVAARAAPRPSEVLPTNPDARVARAGNERWLVVKASPEAAWATLKDFWTKNGFVLAVEQPALGIMETDWGRAAPTSPRAGCNSSRTSTSASRSIPTSATNSGRGSSEAASRARSRSTSATAAPSRSR